LGTFDWFQPSLVFYAKRPVDRLSAEKDLITYLRHPIPAYVAMPVARWEALKGKVEGAGEAGEVLPDFYRRCEVVLIGNAAARAAR
jgi:hypothetical protein